MLTILSMQVSTNETNHAINCSSTGDNDAAGKSEVEQELSGIEEDGGTAVEECRLQRREEQKNGSEKNSHRQAAKDDSDHRGGILRNTIAVSTCDRKWKLDVGIYSNMQDMLI
jgi:hypothetical protein